MIDLYKSIVIVSHCLSPNYPFSLSHSAIINRWSQPVLHFGREKITLEDDINYLILKNGFVTYADIVSRIKISYEYITQTMKNILSY